MRYWHTDGNVWYLYNVKPPISETIFVGVNPRNRRQAVILYSGINAPMYAVRLGHAPGPPYLIGLSSGIVKVGYHGSSKISRFDLATGQVVRDPET